MRADREDVLVIPKPRALVMIWVAVLVLAGIACFIVYEHYAAVHKAEVTAAQRHLDYLKDKQSELTNSGKEISAQWETFDSTISDAEEAGGKRHDGFVAGTLSNEDGKELAETERDDVEELGMVLDTIQADDVKEADVYQGLYGADAAAAFTRDTEKRNEDYAQMQTFWLRAAQDNVDDIAADINGRDESTASSDIEHAYDQANSYENMANTAQLDVARDAKALNDRLSNDIKNAKAVLAKLK